MRKAMDFVDPNSPSLPLPPSLRAWSAPGRPSLFLDFDGTLVELASGPDAIKPRADLAARLGALAEKLDGALAIVSGRAIPDIEKHIGALSFAAAGSHGSDVRLANGSSAGVPPKVLPERMEAELRCFAAANGIDYEHKPHGGALHYRSAPGKEEDAKSFADELAASHGWAVQHGKCVVELVAGHSDKGTAVAALMQEPPFAGTKPLFVGDDLTDEKGFAVCDGFGGGGVLVGERTPTAAHYQLPNVASVHDWLGL